MERWPQPTVSTKAQTSDTGLSWIMSDPSSHHGVTPQNLKNQSWGPDEPCLLSSPPCAAPLGADSGIGYLPGFSQWGISKPEKQRLDKHIQACPLGRWILCCEKAQAALPKRHHVGGLEDEAACGGGHLCGRGPRPYASDPAGPSGTEVPPDAPRVNLHLTD